MWASGGLSKSVGLGAGPQEYLAFQVHTFPAAHAARARWNSGNSTSPAKSFHDRPAYQALADAGVDEYGRRALRRSCNSGDRCG